MKRFRFLAVAEWEACALAAGSMVQKRLPVELFHHVPRVGALLWVQEPFIHLEGRGRDGFFEEIQYRADAGPAGGFAPSTESRNRQCRVHVHEARHMKCGESRFTLEVTRAWERPWSYFEIGDRDREGLPFLKQAVPHLTLTRALTAYWARSYPEAAQGESEKGPPVLMLQFRVHKLNIAELLRQRASPCARSDGVELTKPDATPAGAVVALRSGAADRRDGHESHRGGAILPDISGKAVA